MQELSVLLTLAAVFAIALVSPGPDVALVVRTSLHQGRRAGLASALGLACGILLHTTLVLTGVSLLLSRTPVLFAILQALGALYLAWLGVQGLRDAWSPPLAAEDAGEQGRNAFGAGAAISLSNPKNVVYWGALGSALAGIVDGTPNQAQSLVFFAGFMLSSLIWCFCCAALVDWLRRNTSLFWHRVSYAGCGVLLLGLAGLAQLAFYFVGYAALFFVALYAASIVFGIRLGLRIGLLGQLKEQVRQRYPRLAPASGERISLWRAAGFRLAPWLGVSGSILVGLLVPLYNGVLLLLALAYLNIRFLLPATLAGLADALVGADLVLTGEGRLDAQSLHGKTPVGVARIARQAGVPVVALAGSLGDGYQRLHDAGIDAAFSLAPGPISLEQACAGAAAELEARAEQIARLWRLAQASREG